MDARDSSSAAAASVAVASPRHGQMDDDGAALTVTCGLAKDAASLFQSGHYAECVEVLNQILQKKEDDPKVLHNTAIAEYFRDGCPDPRALLDTKSEELARASMEELEVSGVVTSPPKGNIDTLNQMPSNSATVSYADQIDTSIVTLNTAVILFHLHEYPRALSLLEPLYQKLHPLDETTALHVCLLLIDAALASNNASGAGDVIQYMEKSFGDGYVVNQGDNGNIVQQQPSSQAALKITSTSSALAVPDNVSSDSRVSENPLDRILSEDAIEYETLLSTLDNSGQSMTRPNANNLSSMPIDRPAPTTDLKLKMHLYKVRLLLLTRNLKAAKREVKLGMNVARGRDSSIALLLKSQLEYARGNHRKAIKLLMTSSNKTEPGDFSIFNNNLGCIYHHLQKHHTSIALFSKALRSSSSLKQEKPLKLLNFSQDKSLLISYNCGLQYLSCGRPLMAAQCFRLAAPALYNKPLLWLRFAECCLLAQSKGVLKTNLTSFCSWPDQVKVHVVGSGKWRQLAVSTSSRDSHLGSPSESGPSVGSHHFTLSLPFARQCLLNSLHLLDKLGPRSSVLDHAGNAGFRSSNYKNAQSDIESDSRDNRGNVSSNAAAVDSSVSAYEGLCRRENNMVKQAALADLAYVELSLNNPLGALSVAWELQQLPGCSRMYTFFSRVYAAEALCRLNQPEEAADHLSVYLSEGNNVEFPYSEEDGLKWLTEKDAYSEESNGPAAIKQQMAPPEPKFSLFLRPEEACGALFVNLGALHAIQGNLDQARLFLRKALLAIPGNPQALAAAAYVDLRWGSSQMP
ncbi:unnamed protein product [Spirodela intermedia]|uniref:Uncharacterized protein n=1 Tax=Spirodela intermedia TaxID=51605 RepID=A0A7I8JK15_SPIIN|nr:unnamed protein product [Spirodela intermedia]CAA6670484.1 unnamed protein product [Spirodela intermedia]